MKRTFLQIMAACSVVLVASYVVAGSETDTDSTETIAGNEWVEVELSFRADNSLDLYPPGNLYDFKFSKLDCLENIKLDLEVRIKGEGLQKNGDVYLLRSPVDVDCDNDNDINQCETIDSKTMTLASGATETIISFIDLNVRDLMGVEAASVCNTSTETRRTQLWVGILESAGQYDEAVDLLYSFISPSLDFNGPSQIPVITRVLVGSGNAEVHFQKITAADVKGFIAVAAQAGSSDCSSGPLSANASLDTLGAGVVVSNTFSESSDETSLKIGKLKDNTSYQVAVATVDAAGNPSTLSAPDCATPQQSIGIGDGVETDGEFCFIATAAFGSYEHPTVKVLRVFRDQFLRQLPLGSKVIQAYYSAGPTLAGMIQDDAAVKEMVRSALGLFAGLSAVLVGFGPLTVFFGLIGAMFLGLILGVAAPRAKEK